MNLLKKLKPPWMIPERLGYGFLGMLKRSLWSL